MLVKEAIDFVRKSPERRDVLPWAGAHGGCEEDAERGEAEAALAMLRRLSTAEDADASVRIIGEVTDGKGWCGDREVRGTEFSQEATAHVHDVLLYEVQSTWQRAEFHAIELYVLKKKPVSNLRV
jgi:hypothetical protein